MTRKIAAKPKPKPTKRVAPRDKYVSRPWQEGEEARVRGAITAVAAELKERPHAVDALSTTLHIVPLAAALQADNGILLGVRIVGYIERDGVRYELPAQGGHVILDCHGAQEKEAATTGGRERKDTDG